MRKGSHSCGLAAGCVRTEGDPADVTECVDTGRALTQLINTTVAIPTDTDRWK